MEHDHVANKFVGGDESHKLGTLSNLFRGMAQKVKDATPADESDQGNTRANKNLILNELRLAGEHLVFKWTSIDPGIKCSVVVASINVKKVTPELLTAVLELLTDTLQSTVWVWLSRHRTLLDAIGLHSTASQNIRSASFSLEH